MTKRVLIIGGYGNFGGYIAKVLSRETDIQLILAGRRIEKANALAKKIAAQNPIETAYLDINKDLSTQLSKLNPDIVIHTSGPFQGQGYQVASACITQSCHYIDLADARNFVVNIAQLNQAAESANVLICSGASSVPCLSAAVIEHFQPEFKTLESIEYAIATAQRTNLGLATTAAGLSYAGAPFTTLIDGQMQEIYGWQDLRWRDFWKLNKRGLANCDIPDLSLFPQRYPTLKTIRFQAGLELKTLQYILCCFAWLVKHKLLPKLDRFAALFLKISRLFDYIGNNNSGFYMQLSGTDHQDQTQEILFEISASDGDGLYIPCIPSILLTLKLARGGINTIGAQPCIGFINLAEYLKALTDLNITWRVNKNGEACRDARIH